MHTQTVSTTLAAGCLCVLAIYILLTGVQRYLTLRHIPGPFTASLTNLWLLKVMRYGNLAKKAVELDRRYGPVVRYGPKRVMFSQIEAISTIHGTTNVMPKAENYNIITPMINGRLTPSFASIRDEHRVSAIQRQVRNAYSTTAILDYESHIDETINLLVSNLRDSGNRVNLQQWLTYFTFDTMCRLAFSDDPGMMSRQQDVGDTARGGRERFLYWNHWFAIPHIEALLYKSRFVRNVVSQNILVKMTTDRVQDRMQKGGAGTYDDLLDRYFKARERAPDVFDVPTIASLTLSTIHAGSETVAHTLSHVFISLFRHPEVYERLKRECREAALSSPPTFAEVKKLPFVEAVIKESQRVNQLIIFPLEHVVSEGGATICDTYVSAETVVAINHHVLALSPATTFSPQRWLDATPAQHAFMEKASLAFSTGKRGCLGVNLAWAEMLKVLPELVRRFDIEFAAGAGAEVKVEQCEKMVAFVDGLDVSIWEREWDEK